MTQNAAPEVLVDPVHDQRLLLDKVVTGLRHLSHEHREALILVGVLEMSYQEAALISGVAVGTMKSRISRARAELHDVMSRAKEPPAQGLLSEVVDRKLSVCAR